MRKEGKPKQWITIFPDYPRAFAWLLSPCEEHELSSFVGGCCGDLYPKEKRGEFWTDEGKEELPEWLALRFISWMDKWEDIDENHRMGEEECPTAEALALDAEGVELTRELKKLFGDKYRFRYSYAWRYGEGDWLVV